MLGDMRWFELLGVIAAIVGIVVPLGGLAINMYLKTKPKPRETIVTNDFTYFDVKDGIDRIVSWAAGRRFVAIVGINRGGAIVGGMIGKQLGLAPLVLHVGRSNANENRVLDGVAVNIRRRSVLLVDDRVVDGMNMKSAYEYLVEKEARVNTAVFVLTENYNRVCVPDYFAYTALSREQLLPWEPKGGAKEIHFSFLVKDEPK